MINIKFDLLNLLWSLFAATIIYVVLAFIIDFFGLVQLDGKSILVSIPTVGGVIILIVLSALTSGEVPWSKQGHDFSILAFGAVISTATLQFFSKDPALPRLANGAIGRALGAYFNNDLRAMMWVILFCLAIITIVMCVISALIETGLRNATAGISRIKKI